MSGFKCSVCGRGLTDPHSIRNGIGPVCAAKHGPLDTPNADATLANTFLFAPPLREELVLQRLPDGTAQTNVPQLVVWHSPTGFEWGYAGSGPADLALNLVEFVLRLRKYKGKQARSLPCFAMSVELHQEFKRRFVEQLPHAGTAIPFAEVEALVLELVGDHTFEQARLLTSLFDPTEFETVKGESNNG
jgi:hypothetical protein